MCGFPLVQLNKYLKVLVQQHNRFVAMCEEFPRSPSLGAKGGFDRRVVRIVTPGTLIDEPFLNPYENNYLLSIAAPEPASTTASHEANTSLSSCTRSSAVGLAWIDVSTGEFYTKRTTVGALQDELVRISPREVILDERLSERDPIRRAVSEENYFVSPFAVAERLGEACTTAAAEDLSPDDITSQIEASKEILPTSLSVEESGAVELLTGFMHANLLEHMPSLSAPSRESFTCRMQIDSHTVKALEIREGMREGGATGSLLSVIKRTVTSSGTRLLARWLCESLLQLVNRRLCSSSNVQARPVHPSRRSTLASHWLLSSMLALSSARIWCRAFATQRIPLASYRSSFLAVGPSKTSLLSARLSIAGLQSRSGSSWREEWTNEAARRSTQPSGRALAP